MPHRAESMQKRRKVLRSNAFRRASYLHTQEVTGSSPAVSTTYEKSELIPQEEREFGFFIFIKNNSYCYLCPEDGRILRAYLFSHWIPAISSAAVVVPNHRREEPEGIESPKPQA